QRDGRFRQDDARPEGGLSQGEVGPDSRLARGRLAVPAGRTARRPRPRPGSGSYHEPSTSIASWPRLCSETDTGSPHSEQRMVPQANNVAKIMSSNVSPSPRAYHGPSSAMRSRTSAAGVSGDSQNRQWQLGQ